MDIDAYACMVAMTQLLRLQGENATAYSKAPYNYSVCKSLIEEGQISNELSSEFGDAQYIIVDVSDPEFLKDFLPLEKVVQVYDHHSGFEEFWKNSIGNDAHIEFIGAAATLIYREWKKAGLQDKLPLATIKLLIAAILDNTLNLTSSNTTAEDIETFKELCAISNVTEEWCALYFSQVQTSILSDLKNAILNDVKTVRNNAILPNSIAQLCIWDAQRVLSKLPEIRTIFADYSDNWMINIVDIKHCVGYLICDDEKRQEGLEKLFDVRFEAGVAKTQAPYLRKQIIKKTLLA